MSQLFDPRETELAGANKVAYDALGITAKEDWEVGQALHAWSGFHAADVRCDSCSRVGSNRLSHLKTAGLARRRRDGMWLAVRVKTKQTDEIPY